MRRSGFIGAVILGLAIVIGIVLLALCTTRVPAGYVAVKYNMNGGVQDDILTQGWHLVPPTVKTTRYTVGLEQSYLTSDERGDSKEDESFEGSSSEGKAIKIDLTFTYQYQPENVVGVFKRFKGQSGKEVRDSFIKPNIIAWTKEIVAKYKVSDIIGAERANINTAMTEYLAKKFEPYGITITNASLINVDVDQDTRDAINKKITAQQNYETQAIENKTAVDKAEAEAQVERTKAQGKADAQLIKAEAQAKANKLLNESLTDSVLKQHYLDKWDGVLPKVSGDGSMILDVGELVTE